MTDVDVGALAVIVVLVLAGYLLLCERLRA